MNYFLGSIFIVVIDNAANTFLKTQKKMSSKQARWQEFLANFRFEWSHQPGRHNVVVDALSKKEVMAYVTHHQKSSLTSMRGSSRLRTKLDTDYDILRQ